MRNSIAIFPLRFYTPGSPSRYVYRLTPGPARIVIIHSEGKRTYDGHTGCLSKLLWTGTTTFILISVALFSFLFALFKWHLRVGSCALSTQKGCNRLCQDATVRVKWVSIWTRKLKLVFAYLWTVNTGCKEFNQLRRTREREEKKSRWEELPCTLATFTHK